MPTLHFPNSLAIGGFDNNTSTNTASASLVEAYHQAAEKMASLVASEAEAVLGCLPEESGLSGCVLPWLEEFAARAWRRPLTESEWSKIEQATQQWSEASEPSIALQLSLQYLLQSPDFIYLPEMGDPAREASEDRSLTAWELASRLSYFLWSSLPDSALFDAAADGSLLEEDVLREHAIRLLRDPKAKRGLKNFTRQWLDLDKIGTNALDLELYFPENDDEEEVSDYLHQVLQPIMRLEPEVFVDQIVFHQTGTLAELLTSQQVWTTHQLAEIYDADFSDSGTPVNWAGKVFIEGFEIEYEVPYYPMDWNPDERVGLLGLSGFLHSHSKPVFPSPVLRGVFVLERLLCQPPGAPPEDVPALESEEDTAAPLTNRDRYAAHSSNSACAACHDRIDGVGFPFENFDSLGRYRSTDNGYAVDATGEIIGTDVDGPVDDAVDLAERLAQSRTVHDCLSTQFFRYAFARPEEDGDAPALNFYQDGFWQADGDIPELMLNISTSKAFRRLRGQE